MTGTPTRVLDPSDYYDSLPATLWKPANLPRLPSNASPELKKRTVDVHDPKKVYVLYRAQRRHGFQDLVQRFEDQLVYGCQAGFCDTPTCFTCARRVAGKAPIRRFHDTSARTLACYLASQDDPERNLCLNPSAAPLDKSAVYNTKHSKSSASRRDAKGAVLPGPPVQSEASAARGEARAARKAARVAREAARVAREAEELEIYGEVDTPEKTEAELEASAVLAERMLRLRLPRKKDNKSFIQSLYGTVSLRMLDWLTPQSLYALSSPETTRFAPQKDGSEILAVPQRAPEEQSPKTRPSAPKTNYSTSTQPDLALPKPQENRRNPEIQATGITLNGNAKTEPSTPELMPDSPNPMIPSKSRTIILPSQPAVSDGQAEISDTDTVPALGPEKQIKPSIPRRRSSRKSHRLSANRPVTSVIDLSVETEVREIEAVGEEGRFKMGQPTEKTESLESSHQPCNEPEPKVNGIHESMDSEGELDKAHSPDNVEMRPQTISSLTPEIVEFFCNFMQDNSFCEKHDLYPTEIGTQLRRKRRDVPPIKFAASAGPRDNKANMEWKRFIEQSFFYVLSNPEELLRSFQTEEGYLMDSVSMWYILVRLTRVCPTLVFDSLWISSSRLFSPPKELQQRYSWIPKSGSDTKALGPFRTEEAAQLVLICLHALVAALPLKWEDTHLAARAAPWSRIFHGERRATPGPLSPWLYRHHLPYYDAFTNEPALRLARRLFSGIASTLRYENLSLMERGELVDEIPGRATLFDILLEFIESNQFKESDTLIDFSHERSIDDLDATMDPPPPFPTPTYHDLSKQLMEWARTVILQEWKGEVEIPKDGIIGGALAFMGAMYVNLDRVSLTESDFVVEQIAGRLSTMEIPVEWLSFTPNRKTLHLLDHPFLFKSSSLVDYFRSINLHRMRKAYETAVNYNSRVNVMMASGRLMNDPNDRKRLLNRLRTALTKYLVLEVRRDRVLQDTFDQLWRREVRELLRPFKVRLGEENGEEGLDLGGVQQEFFRLAIAEALDPKYGTFSVDERTKMTWFIPGSLTPLWRCELIGLIVSLAVYNGLTLPVTFPRAMYRKLLGFENTEIEHIEDGWPDLAKGLTTLLEWDEEKDGSVADVFSRTYEFSVESFGEQISRDMSESSTWPQFGNTELVSPKEAPLVDGSNRTAYVRDYIRWLTDVSIRPQFEAFKAGFYTCLDRRSLYLFEPHILQTLVEGVQEIDISELRRNTRYIGWSSSNRTVRDFWSVVKRYDMGQKKKLLEFVTASDRVPVGGMQGLNFVLQKNGAGDSQRLPTSYTCFATLLLPEYESKAVLGEKLEIAINNAKGFGFA